MSLAVGFLVDERDLLLFVDEEAFLHFSSKTLFFLLEVEGLESPFEMAKSLQKMGQMMEKSWGYTRGMSGMAGKHIKQGGESFKWEVSLSSSKKTILWLKS